MFEDMGKDRFQRVNGDFGLRERRGTGLGFRKYLEMLGRPALQKTNVERGRACGITDTRLS